MNPVPVFLQAVIVAALGFGLAGPAAAARAVRDTSAAMPATGEARSPATQHCGFGGAQREALDACRRGWLAIVRDGRWAEGGELQAAAAAVARARERDSRHLLADRLRKRIETARSAAS